MKPEIIELARHRMDRSRQTCDEARILFESQKYNGAMNRVYYSMFYAVSAVLILEGYSSAKHSGTISLFLQHYVKENRAPEETGKFLREVFKSRSRGDYDDYTEFSGEQVKQALNELAGHLSIIEKTILEMIGG